MAAETERPGGARTPSRRGARWEWTPRARRGPARTPPPPCRKRIYGPAPALPPVPPTYSVLIPVRNGEATIVDTMDSILGQSLPPAAVAVVDDGSTDGTAGILARYGEEHPGLVRVMRTGSTATDFTRIPRLLNMCLERGHEYHMMGAGDCRLAPDYAEIVLGRMEGDARVAVASGHYGDGAPPHDPHGAGRLVRQAWFFSEYDRYPERVGFEPEVVFRARLSGMRADVYPEARYDHLDSLGHGHNFSEFGHSMRALGYHPLYALGRCAKSLLFGDIPRRGALNMLWQYASYRPAAAGYYEARPAELRRRVRRLQADAMAGRLGLRRGRPAHGAKRGEAAAPFTVVVPFRDTPRGREFAARFLPSAAALGPAEILVGVDSPADPGLAGFLAGAAGEGGEARARLVRPVEVERSPGWKMHPARVVDECFGRCGTDVALLCNIDTVLRRGALKGLGMVGAASDGRAALVSLSLRLRTDGPGSAVRYCASRVRSRMRGAANSGTFWIHLPDYFGRVDRAGYAGIANGFDTYLFESLAASPGATVIADRSLGADSLDRENGDLEWRQFGYGVWAYANRRGGGGTASRVRSAASIIKHAAVNCHPHSLRGWRWARANPLSEPVRTASGIGYAEWSTYHEPGQVRGLMDWPERGTGFAG